MTQATTGRPRSCLFVAGMLLLLLSGRVRAERVVRLPLDGYYRVGRCMPVWVEPSDAAMTIRIDGSTPTRVSAGWAGVVPVLMLGPTSGAVGLSDDAANEVVQSLQLRALAGPERLVGVIGSSTTPAVASELYPGQTIVSVSLDAIEPLPGPAIAWEALDGLILDGPLVPALRQKLPALLAAGTRLAVRAQAAPDPTWPWRRVNQWWVLWAEVVGPSGSIGAEAAYLPVEAWQPAQPATLRRQVVLVAVLVLLLMLSTLLVRRSRWSLAAMLVVTVICTGAIEAWRRSQPSIRRAGGDILIVGGDRLVQRDAWAYFASARERTEPPPVSEFGRPVVVDSAHAQRTNLVLRCKASGEVEWEYRLSSGVKLAFLLRSIEQSAALPSSRDSSTSPLHLLARHLYLRPGMHTIGEANPRANDDWPTVVIQRD